MNHRYKLRRREFLRLMGIAAGGVYAGSLSGCDALSSIWERQPVVKVESWHKGVCRFCGTGCGVMIGRSNGKVVDVKGDELA